jgi:hypothetical protein
MPPTIQVGSILMKDWPGGTRLLSLESEPCSGNWSVLKVLDSFALDRKIHAAGWNFFFMAAEVKVMFFGVVAAAKIESALRSLLHKVRPQHFNSLEITGIVSRHFLGVPYVTVSAHSRHIQQNWQLDSSEARQTSQHDGEWATG